MKPAKSEYGGEMALPEPRLEHFCDLTVELSPIIEMGEGRGGKRRIIPIIGGRARGPGLTGKILNIGADWQTIYRDGMAELDARYAVESDDGAIIGIRNFGYRHGPEEVIARLAAGEDVEPGAYYMRTQARLETGDKRYERVNRMLFAGTGARRKSAVEISLYAIL